MAGVRGFADPNVHISANTKKSVFHQPVDSTVKPKPPAGVSELLPWHINARGGDSEDRYQCMLAGSNGWSANHAFWNKGQIDRAAYSITPYSLGYYKRADLPFHFALADAFTIADAYHESIIAETDPNRMSWGASTNGIDQAKKGLNGPVLDNHASPGCVSSDNNDGFEYSCYPFKWKTVPEYFEDVGISWQVYQDQDNFDDNPFQYFENYIDAPQGSPLAERGMARIGLDRFYADARAGNLPQVSFIVGPTDLSEHPPYGPLDGAWLQEQVVQAVLQSPKYNSSALIISYDETGGWADHVISPLPPTGTSGEYIKDFYNASLGIQPNGPGFRVPLTIVSPWSHGGRVFSEISAHESQILFLESWAAANGKPFHANEMTDWRRQQLSNLVKAFDFSNKNTSLPTLPTVRAPSKDPSSGSYNGGSVCSAKYPDHQPTVPFGKQTEEDALFVEKGFKQLIGNPSEGRYLVFEAMQGSLALAYDRGAVRLTIGRASVDHSDKLQRFVLTAVNDTPNNNLFTIRTASASGNVPTKFITATLQLSANAAQAGQFAISDLGNGQGYHITEKQSGQALSIPTSGPTPKLSPGLLAFKIFSVTG